MTVKNWKKAATGAAVGTTLVALAAQPTGQTATRAESDPGTNVVDKRIVDGTAAVGAAPGVPLKPGAEIRSHLYALTREDVPRTGADGPVYEGAIEAIGDDLLVVRPKQGDGGIVLIRPQGEVEYLAGEVPTNVSALRTLPDDAAHQWVLRNFRVTDILLDEVSADRFDLYAAHHYVDGECVRFRVSSTGITRGEGTFVHPSWKTVFDAGVCFAPSWLPLHQSSGKMLMDNPDHLLLMVGDYGKGAGRGGGPAPHSLAPPLGQLLRVAVATGETKTLTRGHRCSQGLARDAAGNLWNVEHGPRGGDELNLLEHGGRRWFRRRPIRDYGCPTVSYGLGYNEPGGSLPPPAAGGESMTESARRAVGRHTGGFTPPIFAWVPSIAPTAIVRNDARRFPLWGDDLLVGSLRAKALFRIRLLDKRVQYVEKIPFGTGIRDMAWMPDGRLALLHASSTGVSFLKRSNEYCGRDSPQEGGAYALHCNDSLRHPP